MAKSAFLKFCLSDYNKDVFIKSSDIVRIYPSGNYCRIVSQDGTSMTVQGTVEEIIAKIEDGLK